MAGASIECRNAPPRVREVAPRATSCSSRADTARSVSGLVNKKVKKMKGTRRKSAALVARSSLLVARYALLHFQRRKRPIAVPAQSTHAQWITERHHPVGRPHKADDWVEIATFEQPYSTRIRERELQPIVRTPSRANANRHEHAAQRGLRIHLSLRCFVRRQPRFQRWKRSTIAAPAVHTVRTPPQSARATELIGALDARLIRKRPCRFIARPAYPLTRGEDFRALLDRFAPAGEHSANSTGPRKPPATS